MIEAGYTGSRGGHGINQVHANPSVLTAEQAALVAATKNANAIPSVQARRVYPQYGVRTLIPAYTGPAGNDVEARSEYNGVYVSVNKRFSHGVQFGVSYTRSKFESNNDASLGETGTDGSNQRPQSMFDYEAEWSLSQFDVPNRFVVNYTVGGPRAQVRLPEAHPRRLAVLGHHRVPVRAARSRSGPASTRTATGRPAPTGRTWAAARSTGTTSTAPSRTTAT